MSRLEDVFMEDDDGKGNALEQIIEGGEDLSPRNSDVESQGMSDHSEAEEEPARRVEPPKEKKEKKVIKNPSVVLNPKRLIGPRGIQTIESFFKDFKFDGRGHEKDDLDRVMKRLEHWAHRLFPKYQFDDSIDKIASLGHKKQIAAHIRLIRLGLIDEENRDTVQQQDDSDAEEAAALPADEFDILLEQQIALARSTPGSALRPVVQYDDSPGFNPKTPRSMMDNDFDEMATPLSPKNFSTPISRGNPVVQKTIETGISEEQKARMLKNRMMAEEKRFARLKEKEERERNEALEMERNNALEVKDNETLGMDEEEVLASERNEVSERKRNEALERERNEALEMERNNALEVEDNETLGMDKEEALASQRNEVSERVTNEALELEVNETLERESNGELEVEKKQAMEGKKNELLEKEKKSSSEIEKNKTLEEENILESIEMEEAFDNMETNDVL